MSIIKPYFFARKNISNPYNQVEKLLYHPEKLKDKVVVITGASSGIGKACALEFAKCGAKVAISSRRKAILEDVAQDIINLGGQALCVEADISEVEACKYLIEKTVDTFGGIDILINNAGISMRASFEDLDLKVIKELMDTNFYGTVYCSKFSLPYLLKSKGTIIGISSISGLAPLPGRTGYTASKHAMDGFLNTLRLENMKKGLNVIVVHPGFTSSNIRHTALNKDGLPQVDSPRKEAKMMSSERVAQIIVKAVLKRDRDLVLTPQGKMVVWLHKYMPQLADRILLHEMEKEPNSPVKS